MDAEDALIVGDPRESAPICVLNLLALFAAILWGLAGWVLDRLFGRRKQTRDTSYAIRNA